MVKTAELNGKRGRVCNFDEGLARYEVEVQNPARTLHVRPENCLLVLSEASVLDAID